MPAEDYLLGLGLLTVTVAFVLAGTALVLRRRLPQLAGAPRGVAFGVVATAGMIAVHLIPAALGMLARGSVLAAAALLLFLASRLPEARPRPDAATEQSRPTPESGLLSWVLATTAASVAAVSAFAHVLSERDQAIVGIDGVNFHLSGVARWIQSGSIWEINQFLPDLAHGNYPNNGDVILLSLVLPWHNDAFVRFAELPFLALLGVAVYALAMELRAPRTSAIAFAAALVALPTVLVPALDDAMPDATMLATFAAGSLFLARHVRTGQTAELVLAGVALGISFGTKWYGVSSVAVVVGVWAVAMIAARRSPATVSRQGAALIGLVAAGGGIWLVRNLVESGNPLFPVKVAPLGITIFDAPPDRVREEGGFTLAGYLGDWDVWDRFILPAFERTYGLGGAVLVLGALVAVGTVLGRRLHHRSVPAHHWVVLALLAAAVLLTVAYFITPYSALGPDGRPVQVDANTRYGVPGLVLAAAVAAFAAGRLGRLRSLAEAGALAGALDGVRRSFDLAVGDVLVGALVLAVAGAVVGAVATLLRRGRLAPAAGIAAAVIGLAVVSGHRTQQHFNDLRYRDGDRAVAWIVANAPRDHRIGLTGVWSNRGVSPVFPSFGPRLDNEVTFVGPWVDAMLRQYGDAAAFTAALEHGDYDLLVVGRGFPRPLPTVEEARWAAAAGYGPIARSERLLVFARDAQPRAARPKSRGS